MEKVVRLKNKQQRRGERTIKPSKRNMLKSITVSFDDTSLKIYSNASLSDTNYKFKYPMQSKPGVGSEWPEGEVIDIWKETDKMSIDQYWLWFVTNSTAEV